MDKIEQAFPNPHRTDMGGMSLRDYFAARAMAICPLRDLAEKSEWCYELADAMLKARKQA